MKNLLCVLSLFLIMIPLGASGNQCVDFEDLIPDKSYSVGDIFADSGTKISVESVEGPGGTPWLFRHLVRVEKGRAMAGGSGIEIFMDPGNLRFHFRYPLKGLFLKFGEYGVGNINIDINGDFRNVTHMVDLNGMTIGGVAVSVIGGLPKGILELNGTINSFMVGGFELFIDDVCPLIKGDSVYFSDATESPGSVYHYRSDIKTRTSIYTRAADRLSSFAFAPWDPDLLYYVNASDKHIFSVQLDTSGLTENTIYSHTTYVRDIAFDQSGILYFSESTGAGGDGKIWRVETGTTASLYYTVKLSDVGGFWAGHFTFGPDGSLYLSSGNCIPSSIYHVDMAANTVTDIFHSPGASTTGITFGPEDMLYFADNGPNIYSFDLTTMADQLAYTDPVKKIRDVGFREIDTVSSIPGTWVMPYSIRYIPLYNIKPTGLTDYTDSLSGREMVDAPFGGTLLFHMNSSNNIPTHEVYYYRFQYKLSTSSGWNDFDENISVHYVKNRPGLTPIFPTLKLGPYEVNNMQLYRFRPHESELPSLVTLGPLETAEWPKTAFPGDVYRGRLSTAVKNLPPGKYDIRIEIYDETGAIRTVPGTFFDMIVPTGTASDGTILTDPAGPTQIIDEGFQFPVHIDNRKCGADIDPPFILGGGTTDPCGFLRYLPPSEPVNISWNASHPGGFGVFRLNIVKAADSVGTIPLIGGTVPFISIPIKTEVSIVDPDIHGTGSGDFNFITTTEGLLDGCLEAAFAIDLDVYAKATTGNGQRIVYYDAYDLRAFALAPW
ncbi:MAG: WD40 repeat domain-containing protein [Spirochaetales bacterium]|nr:WD40 repeat domain-containing protein [Spirochaetales bacterium]